MLYVDTFGAFGGVGRCSIELLPYLARQVGKVTVAGQSHVVDSLARALPATDHLCFRNLERPRLHPATWALRALAQSRPDSTAFTHAMLDRAGIRAHNRQPVLINYPQAMAAPDKPYEFDILVHDLNWRRYPEASDDPTLDRRCGEWVRQARRIFTNSEFTRRDVIEAYGVEGGRVIAAPLAPPSLPAGQSSAGDAEKLAAFGLKPEGYFFYPSVHGLHKGHDVLADALTTANALILPVIITAAIASGADPGHPEKQKYFRKLSAKLEALRQAGRIVSLNHLPWDQVLLIAGSCRAYVLPSRFEGFGFPLVEAMALGKFSICSEIPAFREIIDRYGPKIRAATFPVGDADALRGLLIAKSGANEAENNLPRPDLSTSWGWADTAKAIATAL